MTKPHFRGIQAENGRQVGPSGAYATRRSVTDGDRYGLSAVIAQFVGTHGEMGKPAPGSPAHRGTKKGGRGPPRLVQIFAYSSKRRRNRSSIRLVNEPPDPLPRR